MEEQGKETRSSGDSARAHIELIPAEDCQRLAEKANAVSPGKPDADLLGLLDLRNGELRGIFIFGKLQLGLNLSIGAARGLHAGLEKLLTLAEVARIAKSLPDEPEESVETSLDNSSEGLVN